MKKLSVVLLAVFFLLSSMGCTVSSNNASANSSTVAKNSSIKNEKQTTLEEVITQSYYKGQGARAFRMLQKHIFQNVLESCTTANLTDIENPLWNFASFAHYTILDQNLTPIEQEQELYYCTFSADHDKTGYIVLSYSGDGLSHIATVETSYLYDLQENVKDIMAALEGMKFDLSSTTASRVQVFSQENNSTKEAIRIMDQQGHDYFYYFDTPAQ